MLHLPQHFGLLMIAIMILSSPLVAWIYILIKAYQYRNRWLKTPKLVPPDRYADRFLFEYTYAVRTLERSKRFVKGWELIWEGFYKVDSEAMLRGFRSQHPRGCSEEIIQIASWYLVYYYIYRVTRAHPIGQTEVFNVLSGVLESARVFDEKFVKQLTLKSPSETGSNWKHYQWWKDNRDVLIGEYVLVYSDELFHSSKVPSIFDTVTPNSASVGRFRSFVDAEYLKSRIY
jgi:hypothetical protein